MNTDLRIPPGTVRKEWPVLLLLAANAALIAYAWPRTPGRVPVHWNYLGQPDRFGDRFEALVMVPLILLFPVLLTAVIGVGQKNAPQLRQVRLGMVTLSLLLTTHYAFGWDMNRVLMVGLGALFVLVGNGLGKGSPSPYVGLRTPWTARSRLAWERGQRRGAYLLTGLGAVQLLLAATLPLAWLVPVWMPLGFTAVTLGGVVWLVWLSRRDYLRDPRPESPFGRATGGP
jgi:uncharacterized membrane protein